jgi:hypothetical protein
MDNKIANMIISFCSDMPKYYVPPSTKIYLVGLNTLATMWLNQNDNNNVQELTADLEKILIILIPKFISDNFPRDCVQTFSEILCAFFDNKSKMGSDIDIDALINQLNCLKINNNDLITRFNKMNI